MKFISGILGIVAGGLTFLFFSLANFTYTLFGGTGNLTGWDLLSSSGDGTGITLFKIFGIAALVFACLLIVYGLFLLLIDLNVIKAKIKANLNMGNSILFTLFAISVIVAFVGTILMTSSTVIGGVTIASGSIGVGMWIMLVVSVVACLFSWALCATKSKKRK